MKEYKKIKFEEIDIREALAEKFNFPVEDIHRDGYGFAVNKEVEEEKKDAKRN